jgi:hypothetical protein
VTDVTVMRDSAVFVLWADSAAAGFFVQPPLASSVKAAAGFFVSAAGFFVKGK